MERRCRQAAPTCIAFSLLRQYPIRPSSYSLTTLLTIALHPVGSILSFSMRLIPNSELFSVHSWMRVLYRSSKIWRGKSDPGKRTTLSGKSGRFRIRCELIMPIYERRTMRIVPRTDDHSLSRSRIKPVGNIRPIDDIPECSKIVCTAVLVL